MKCVTLFAALRTSPSLCANCTAIGAEAGLSTRSEGWRNHRNLYPSRLRLLGRVASGAGQQTQHVLGKLDILSALQNKWKCHATLCANFLTSKPA